MTKEAIQAVSTTKSANSGFKIIREEIRGA